MRDMGLLRFVLWAANSVRRSLVASTCQKQVVGMSSVKCVEHKAGTAIATTKTCREQRLDP